MFFARKIGLLLLFAIAAIIAANWVSSGQEQQTRTAVDKWHDFVPNPSALSYRQEMTKAEFERLPKNSPCYFVVKKAGLYWALNNSFFQKDIFSGVTTNYGIIKSIEDEKARNRGFVKGVMYIVDFYQDKKRPHFEIVYINKNTLVDTKEYDDGTSPETKHPLFRSCYGSSA